MHVIPANIVELISQDHDVEVQDDLVKQVKIPSQTVNLYCNSVCMLSCTPDLSLFLPSSSDLSILDAELTVHGQYSNYGMFLHFSFDTIITRILIQHMDEFSDQASAVPIHIRSRHSTEMASKSEVVSSFLIDLAMVRYNDYTSDLYSDTNGSLAL